MSLAYAAGSVFRIRRTAERLRSVCVDRLTDRLVDSLTGKEQAGDAEQYRKVIEIIKSVRTGAFETLSRHPLVKAVLLPFGGVGGLALLNYLFSKGF